MNQCYRMTYCCYVTNTTYYCYVTNTTYCCYVTNTMYCCYVTNTTYCCYVTNTTYCCYVTNTTYCCCVAGQRSPSLCAASHTWWWRCRSWRASAAGCSPVCSHPCTPVKQCIVWDIWQTYKFTCSFMPLSNYSSELLINRERKGTFV